MASGSCNKLRVLELYSGIGGMHCALKESGLNFEVVAAADINNVANAIYSHNFKHVKILQRCIESLSIAELEKLRVDLITMSPPCQPFCRVGKQKDTRDQRTVSFFHVLDALPKLSKTPRYILLENVKGFDTSVTRGELVDTLTRCGYMFQEFLLSPVQFGIPNSRLRYYLIAKLKPLNFGFPAKSQLWTDIPLCVAESLHHRRDRDSLMNRACGAKWSGVLDVCVVEDTSVQQGNSASDACPQCGRATTLQVQPSLSHPQQFCVCTCLVKQLAVRDRTSSQTNVKIDGANVLNQTVCLEASDAATPCEKSIPNTMECAVTSSDRPINDSDTTNTIETPSLTVASDSQSMSSDTTKPSVTLSSDTVETPLYQLYSSVCHPLREFMETPTSEQYFLPYMVPEKFFRRFWVMDIVTPEMSNTCCFTKRYAHHMEGSGSIIRMRPDNGVDLRVFKERRTYDDQVHESVRSIMLRYFTPREIANLMCFPPEFEFPANVTTMQCYRALGNSLNVHVVAVLMSLLTLGDDL